MPTLDELFELAVRFHQNGNLAQAADLYRQVLRLDPNQAEAHNNLGSIFFKEGQLAEAAASFRKALRVNPNYEETLYNLGLALVGQKQLTEASHCLGQVLRINPNNTNAHYLLGKVLAEQGKNTEAIHCYRQVLRLNPDHYEAHNDLGIALVKQQQLTEGAECFQEALRINPRHVDALINHGNVLRNQGYLEEAIACYRQAMELEPADVTAHSNLVNTLYFCPGQNAESLSAEHRLWSQRHAEPLAKFILPHDNDKSPERRLRIGYVSPNFRGHAESFFTVPLFSAHDRESFEIFLYADVACPDDLTARIQSHADTWRNIVGLSDHDLAQMIRQDRIDILVDLALHSANNRLLVFARKPAPVQVTYLAYPGTSGLGTMDYRLTDPYLDPPGLNDSFYTEQSVRLPETYWCYQTVIESPSPAVPPALKAGHVAFGCLNNFSKVTVLTLETWCRILRAVPESRLILNSPAGNQRARVRDFLAQRNVTPDRLHFVERVPYAEYYQTYEKVDVALDPFPYGGGTTTCDALWMGVPVVSLAGQMAVGRGGVSILSNLGLSELVGQDTEQYVRIAVDLAGDPARLAALRSTLRDRMKKSPLTDAPRFARNVEAAYRAMWRKWCAN